MTRSSSRLGGSNDDVEASGTAHKDTTEEVSAGNALLASPPTPPLWCPRVTMLGTMDALQLRTTNRGKFRRKSTHLEHITIEIIYSLTCRYELLCEICTVQI